jgi:excisionase family DNA binding protein
MGLWRIEEAAEYLGIRPKTLYEWVRKDRIPYRKLGFNVRFDPEELEAWVQQQPAGGARVGKKRPPPRDPSAKGGGKPPATEAVPAGPPAATSDAVAELATVAAEAARQFRRVESDLGAQLSFPQRQQLRELAKRLKEAAEAVQA